MPKLRITPECERAIRAASTAPGGFDGSAAKRRTDSDDFDIDISERTYERVLSLCSSGLTASDAILHALAVTRGSIN